MSKKDYRKLFTYTSNYCEENIYLLVDQLQNERNCIDHFMVVFISNPQFSIALFGQVKGDTQTDHSIIWDYHVILLRLSTATGSVEVYDFDSILPFPCSFVDYSTHVLRSNTLLPPDLKRFYRIIPASVYLAHFASDRRHMWNKSTNQWLAPPPPYGCLRGMTASDEHTLPQFWSMNPLPYSSEQPVDDRYGTVLSEEQFFCRFASSAST